jgi:hypothetical protein
MLASQGNAEANTLADLFCRAARERIEQLFEQFYGGYDAQMYRVAQQVMRGEHAWLETGIISPLEERGDGASLAQTRAHQRTPQATNAV